MASQSDRRYIMHCIRPSRVMHRKLLITIIICVTEKTFLARSLFSRKHEYTCFKYRRCWLRGGGLMMVLNQMSVVNYGAAHVKRFISFHTFGYVAFSACGFRIFYYDDMVLLVFHGNRLEPESELKTCTQYFKTRFKLHQLSTFIDNFFCISLGKDKIFQTDPI